MSKCMCHFCGYEIKDATARSSIAELGTDANLFKTATTEKLEEMEAQIEKAKQALIGVYPMVINTDVSSPAASLSVQDLHIREYRYNQNAGMVFLSLYFSINGTLVSGQELTFKIENESVNFPVTPAPYYPLSVFAVDVNNKFSGYVNSSGVTIRADADVNTGGKTTVVYFSGWYPYDKEE